MIAVHARPYGHRLLFAAVAICMLVLVFGCTDAEPVAQEAETVGQPLTPESWDMATPESSVRSYLEWVSFSYRMANSDIPTATMTAAEAVRVDSYIQLNRMEGKGIEQFLDSIELLTLSEESSAAVITTVETWRYRYFSLDTLKYLTEEYSASYDATYTLVPGPEGWLVDHVEVAPRGEVK